MIKGCQIILSVNLELYKVDGFETSLQPFEVSSFTFAVFTFERFTEVLEFTYLGKYFACVNAN